MQRLIFSTDDPCEKERFSFRTHSGSFARRQRYVRLSSNLARRSHQRRRTESIFRARATQSDHSVACRSVREAELSACSQSFVTPKPRNTRL
jgi:hypothetical protein